MGVKRIPTEQELQKIRTMASQGCARTHIAEELCMDRSTIYRILSEYNIELKPSPVNKKGSKINWNKKNTEKFIEMYANANVTLDDICNEFGISKKSVSVKARDLCLEKEVKHFKWTSHKIRILKECYKSEDFTISDIAQLIDTTEPIVYSKAKELNLSKQRYKNYAEEEIDWLCENKDKLTIKEMAEYLNRSENAIRFKLVKLGESVRISRRIAMPDTEDFKQDIGDPMLSNAVLARKYGVCDTTINKWRKRLYGDFKTMVDTWRCKTTAELDMENILEEMDLAYIYQKVILGWKVDFYLGFKIIVEVQGSHWHDEIEKVIEKDKRKFSELQKAGYTVIKIWDYDLKDKDKVKGIIAKKVVSGVAKSTSSNLVNLTTQGCVINE